MIVSFTHIQSGTAQWDFSEDILYSFIKMQMGSDNNVYLKRCMCLLSQCKHASISYLSSHFDALSYWLCQKKKPENSVIARKFFNIKPMCIHSCIFHKETFFIK